MVPGLRPRWDRRLVRAGLRRHRSRRASTPLACAQFRRAGGQCRPIAALRRRASRTGDGWSIELADGDASARRCWSTPPAPGPTRWPTAAGVAPLGLAPKRRTMVQLRVGAQRASGTCRWSPICTAASISRARATSIWVSPHDETPVDPCDAAPEEIDVAIAIDRFEGVGRLAGRGGRAQMGGPAQLRARPRCRSRLRPDGAGIFLVRGAGRVRASRPRPRRRSCARRAVSLGEPLDPTSLRGDRPAPISRRARSASLSVRWSSASAQASASTRSFSGWPLWPLTQCHSTRCGAEASTSSCHSSAFLTGFLSGGAPAVLPPFVDPAGDPVADIGAVGVELDPARLLERLERRGSRPPAPSGCWWSAARRPRARVPCAPVRSSARPAAGPGVAAARAVGENLDLREDRWRRSGNQLARQFENHALGRVVGDFLADLEALGSASMTSRTSSSGAEAPAVRPRVARLAEPVPVDVGRALDQAGGDAHPLGDLGQPQRIAAVRRADHQHPLAFGGDRLDRRLAVGGGVANVLAARRADRRESAPSSARRSPPCRRPTSVVWVRKARLAGSAPRARRRRRRVSTRVIDPAGTWPKVPITSGWPAWPMNRMWRPSAISRSAWRWTLDTNGQVAST